MPLASVWGARGDGIANHSTRLELRTELGMLGVEAYRQYSGNFAKRQDQCSIHKRFINAVGERG